MPADLCKIRVVLHLRLAFLIEQEGRLMNTKPVVRLANNRTEQIRIRRKLRAVAKALGDIECDSIP